MRAGVVHDPARRLSRWHATASCHHGGTAARRRRAHSGRRGPSEARCRAGRRGAAGRSCRHRRRTPPDHRCWSSRARPCPPISRRAPTWPGVCSSRHASRGLGAERDAPRRFLATPDWARVGAFLDVLERHPELRDADKLGVPRGARRPRRRGTGVGIEDVRAAACADRRGRARALRDRGALHLGTGARVRALPRARDAGTARSLGRLRRPPLDALPGRRDPRHTGAAARRRAEDGPQGAGRDAARDVRPAAAAQPRRAHLRLWSLIPEYTDAIRVMLAERGIPAVFFHVGQNVRTVDAKRAIRPTRAAAASRKLAGAGFTLANHTFSHQPMPGLSDRDIGEQIEATNRIVRTVLGTSPRAVPSALRRPQHPRPGRRAGAAHEVGPLEHRLAGLGRSGAAVDRRPRRRGLRAGEARHHPLPRHPRADDRGASAGAR